MSAPAGNQFWKLRSKHGRDKLFETPEILWEEACKYFEAVEANPYHKAEAKTVNIGDYQSKIEIAKLPVLRPFTIHNLCLFLNCNTKYFNDFDDSLKGKTDPLSLGFSEVITRIRETIYAQKFSGAAAGFFNANIISRDLGLTDKKEVEKKVTRLNFKDAE